MIWVNSSPYAALHGVDEGDIAEPNPTKVSREVATVRPCIITEADVRSSIVSGTGTSDAAAIAIRCV
jgi:hypothetical protein